MLIVLIYLDDLDGFELVPPYFYLSELEFQSLAGPTRRRILGLDKRLRSKHEDRDESTDWSLHTKGRLSNCSLCDSSLIEQSNGVYIIRLTSDEPSLMKRTLTSGTQFDYILAGVTSFELAYALRLDLRKGGNGEGQQALSCLLFPQLSWEADEKLDRLATENGLGIRVWGTVNLTAITRSYVISCWSCSGISESLPESWSVPNRQSDAGKYDNYYGRGLKARCALLSRPDNKTKLRKRDQPTSVGSEVRSIGIL
ncbi:unnamed protein product [Protopolystoma xenopodis]|uniref:Uncharacterized protein n=1 Tax=Protopolystoma xenopodis TaxID=117903 RepID=A0A448WAN4_9PLAT|nr:unnamed protein product [Protopolystoma xenopodis]